MAYWDLFVTFFKVGAFSFGGGYAMIPFFEKEIAIHHWAAAADYQKMIAIAQVLPGSFAIDSSAYIGYQVSGLLGAILASISLSLPSFLLLVFITRFYGQFKSNSYIQMILSGVRPVIIGLLISAAYIIGIQPIVKGLSGTSLVLICKAITLIIAGFWLLKLTKINPILFILLFGIAGIIIF
jgi:chromate transporter